MDTDSGASQNTTGITPSESELFRAKDKIKHMKQRVTHLLKCMQDYRER